MPGNQPTVDIFIPTLNESAHIAETVANPIEEQIDGGIEFEARGRDVAGLIGLLASQEGLVGVLDGDIGARRAVGPLPTCSR